MIEQSDRGSDWPQSQTNVVYAERRSPLVPLGRSPVRTFEEVYEQFKAPLFTYIYRLVGDRELAQDLLQETFVKIYRAFDSLPEGAGATPWIYRVATNTSYDALRRRRLISWLPWNREESSYEPASDDPLIDDDLALREGVMEALRRLPTSLRAPLLLHAVQGFSYADIAEALGTTESAVKMRVSRARAAFKKYYGEDAEGLAQ